MFSGSIEKVLVAFVLISSFALASCGTAHTPNVLDADERSLGVRDNFLGTDHRTFHSILHYPHGLKLNFPGYIVGIEKAGQDSIRGPGYYSPRGRDATEGIDHDAHRRLVSNSKAHFVSHIVKFESITADRSVFGRRIAPCALYSAMSPPRSNEPDKSPSGTRTLVRDNQFEFCPLKEHDGGLRAPSGPSAFSASANALELLQNDLTNKLENEKNYSHIIVLVMGWNTPQDNAVQNFNSLIGNLVSEYEGRLPAGCVGTNSGDSCHFKPLVIGVTWASDWELSSLLPIPSDLVRLISFPNKANDAQEVGVSWLSELIYQTVLPSRDAANTPTKPDVFIVGHSFGARAVLAALVDPPFLQASGADQTRDRFGPHDLFLSFQGAFEIQDLLTVSSDRISVAPPFKDGGLKAVVTATPFDDAVQIARWADYAGTMRGFDFVCSDGRVAGVECFQIAKSQSDDPKDPGYGQSLCVSEDDAKLIGTRTNLPKFSERSLSESNANLLYVDTSHMMNCNSAFTGGRAHSDIFRRETARFLLDILFPVEPQTEDRISNVSDN